jgi:hypothetical protein
MEGIMPTHALETLRRVNDNLRSALFHLRPERKHCSTVRPQDFSYILSQLLTAAECLRHPPVRSEDVAALELEALEYRGNLEKLKHFLPDLHLRLLAEKARIETARAHVAAAATWARASEKTL